MVEDISFRILLLVLLMSRTDLKRQHVRIVLLGPSDRNRMFSLWHVRPVIQYLNTPLRHTHSVLRHVKFSVHYADSHCNSKDAPIKAFEMHRQADLFLGPTCDYSLAPVARFAPVWNIPVVTPGGFAHDFGANKSEEDAEYPTLTRVGLTFNSLTLLVLKLIEQFKWKKVTVVYDGKGHDDVAPRFCYLAAGAFMKYSKDHALPHGFEIFHPTTESVDNMLREDVAADNASK
ncbi:atrial natriuretic peptide receptor 3-like [Gigantopelta aegis]|uniref:atrial natriuretic peptide receptor 3-like n=1 Tax=Gigantopelta aegis TaxID=1735272 RepID=UPI001B889EC8|nr:atrial natriuretic peptide receptor 3-like [Gigantopelta aegis]